MLPHKFIDFVGASPSIVRERDRDFAGYGTAQDLKKVYNTLSSMKDASSAAAALETPGAEHALAPGTQNLAPSIFR